MLLKDHTRFLYLFIKNMSLHVDASEKEMYVPPELHCSRKVCFPPSRSVVKPDGEMTGEKDRGRPANTTSPSSSSKEPSSLAREGPVQPPPRSQQGARRNCAGKFLCGLWRWGKPEEQAGTTRGSDNQIQILNWATLRMCKQDKRV